MKYKSKNYYSNASAFIGEVVIPESDKEDNQYRQSQIKPDIDINELLIRYCDMFALVIKEGEQNAIIDYYQQFVYQLDLDEPLELNREAEDKINNGIKLFIEYTQKLDSTQITKTAVSIIVYLQDKTKNIIDHQYSHTSLTKSITVLHKNIAALQVKFSPPKLDKPKRDLSTDIDLNQTIEILDHHAKALKHSTSKDEAIEIASEIDSNISKCFYQACYATRQKILSDTLNRSNNDSPILFSNMLSKYWEVISRGKLARNFILTAGAIIDKDREGLHSAIASKGYKYSLADLDRLVTDNTRLLVENYELSLHTNKSSWRGRWNKLGDIRKEASKLNPIEQQRYLSEEINNFIREIIEESEEMLGTPPCDYSILSFGSLSRKEFFPCSDLECLVVLDTPKKYSFIITEYFTSLFKLVDIQLKALGEHGKGFGLDSDNPSNNYDQFIITIDDLERAYQEHRSNTVYGYSYSLLKPGLLYSSNKDNNLFQRYEEIMTQALFSIHKEQSINQLRAHIDDYLWMRKEKLSFMSLDEDEINLLNKSINLKESYYSPLVHLAIDLGLYYNIKSNNTLKIYEELHRKGILSSKFFGSLKEAYTYIVELRIEAHNFKKAHYDEVYSPNSNRSGHLILEEEAFEKLRRINIEVITPLYKTIELIVKNELKVSKNEQDIPTGIDYVANTYYKAHSKDKKVLDNPNIIAELVSIYSRHAIRRYSLEKAKQSEAKYFRDGLDSITMFLPAKLSEDAVIVEGAGIRERRMLKPEVAEMLLGEDGSFKEKEQGEYGRRNVRGINYKGYKLHFKENPELPGMEYALGSLIRKITGQGAPITSLLKFSVGNKVYPVQVSRTVEGINFQDALNEGAERLDKISSRSFGLMCIASLLINPEDGKPDNYILEPQQGTGNEDNYYNIVCVDNDHGLVPALAKEKMRTKVMVKTILYCMRQMHENLNKEAREQILTISHTELLRTWLNELDRLDTEYRSLFTVKEHAQLLNQGETKGLKSIVRKYKKEGESPAVMPILIRKGVVATLYQKFQLLQYILEHNEEITPMQLLYIIEPLLAKYYDDPRLKGLGEKQAFNNLFKDQYSTVMAGRYGTMINSRQLLQSILQEVPNLEDIILKKHTPAEAIDELKIIKLQSTTLNKVREELLTGNDKSFKELLLDSFRERVINGNKGEGNKVDFSALYEHKQFFILQSIKSSSFIELKISHCTMLFGTSLEEILKHSPALSILNINSCINIDSSAVRSIASYCPLIEKLVISNIPALSYIGTATGIGSLAFNNLRRLDLSNNTSLNDIKIKAPKLEWLNLSNCTQLTDNVLSILISKCLNIKILTLDGCNKISNIGVKMLHPLLSAFRKELLDTRTISKDTLSFHELKINKREINILSHIIKTTTTITSLCLESNQIEPEGGMVIAKALKTNTTIRKLNFQYNNLNANGAKFLADVLKVNSILTKVDLQYNNIGNKGIKAIAEALGANDTLIELDLMGNNIGDEGIKDIADTLKVNTTLSLLDLGNNTIEDEGAKALAEAFKNNITLQEINIRKNNIGDEGGKEIAKALSINKAITQLDLWDNNISEEILLKIEKYLERNRARKEFGIPISPVNIESKLGIDENSIESIAARINTPPQLARNTEERRAIMVNKADISGIHPTSRVAETLSKEVEATKLELKKVQLSTSSEDTSSSWSNARRIGSRGIDVLKENKAILSGQPKITLLKEGAEEIVRKKPNIERRSTLLQYNASKSSSLSNKPELIAAAKDGKVITVTTLLRDGANPNYADDVQGRSALHYATKLDHIRIVEILINNTIPAHADLQDKEGNTALHIAVNKGHLAIAKMLLDKEVDTNLCNNVGFTPLHYAVSGDHKDLVKLLLAHGADPFIQTNENKVALDYAQSFEMKEIFRQFSKISEISKGGIKYTNI